MQARQGRKVFVTLVDLSHAAIQAEPKKKLRVCIFCAQGQCLGSTYGLHGSRTRVGSVVPQSGVSSVPATRAC